MSKKVKGKLSEQERQTIMKANKLRKIMEEANKQKEQNAKLEK